MRRLIICSSNAGYFVLKIAFIDRVVPFLKQFVVYIVSELCSDWQFFIVLVYRTLGCSGRSCFG